MTPGRGSFRNSVLLVIATVYGIIKEKEGYIMETKEVLVLLRNAHGLTQDELAEKLSYGYPEIEKNPPIFEPEDGPQLNL